MMMKRLTIMLATLLFAGPALAASGLTPHRAVYDMERLQRASGSAFAQVSGRMVYHYDRTCDGVTYNHRMLLDLVTAQGSELQTETVLSFFETGDGLNLRFQVREIFDGVEATALEGKVTRSDVDSPGRITYSRREGVEGDAPETLPPGVLFPLQHTRDLIQAAVDGAVTHNARTFDGDELSLVDSFIRPYEGEWEKAVPDSMDGQKVWTTRVSFYKPDQAEAAPYYETQMRFWENGLSGDFTMETTDLAVQARLTEVEIYDKPDCD
ncbi:MAG: hypothetical protein TEF_13285 [Rhizobiales bacterium NRL2]|nr:MAG: hypothetical protein TEF_13285 [Rhizobiales bacterium NRL2]